MYFGRSDGCCVTHHAVPPVVQPSLYTSMRPSPSISSDIRSTTHRGVARWQVGEGLRNRHHHTHTHTTRRAAHIVVCHTYAHVHPHKHTLTHTYTSTHTHTLMTDYCIT